MHWYEHWWAVGFLFLLTQAFLWGLVWCLHKLRILGLDDYRRPIWRVNAKIKADKNGETWWERVK